MMQVSFIDASPRQEEQLSKSNQNECPPFLFIYLFIFCVGLLLSTNGRQWDDEKKRGGDLTKYAHTKKHNKMGRERESKTPLREQ